MLLVGQANCH